VSDRRPPKPPETLIGRLEALESILIEVGLGAGVEEVIGMPADFVQAQAVNIVRDALIALRMEPDNHHNAAKCPYCNTGGS
jgi:hypothetical protein